MIRIGSQTIDTNIFLAPLAGCSDIPMRLICREHGARFCFYEMVDSNSLVRQRSKSHGILKPHKNDMPIAAQLLGSDPSITLDAAQKLISLAKISFLDFNSACPAKKAIRKKAGAHLLRDRAMLAGIIKALSSSLPIPVTVKLRTGFDNTDYNDLAEIAKICESSGAAALFVHGRTRAQGYAGEVDYRAIKIVKDSVGVPVFGSGNIFTPPLAKKMLDETGCDGIMVARGALGNPWIFNDIEEYFRTGLLVPKRDINFKSSVLKKHLEYVDSYKEIRPLTKIGFMRKVAIWYIKNFSCATEIRRKITCVKSYQELLGLIENILPKS